MEWNLVKGKGINLRIRFIVTNPTDPQSHVAKYLERFKEYKYRRTDGRDDYKHKADGIRKELTASQLHFHLNSV